MNKQSELVPFLNVSGVSWTERNFALKGISFTQEKLQKIAIAGETGSGKSTLLKIIAGWLPPDTGEVVFENERVKKVPAEKLIPGHPGISYLSQQFELPNFLSVQQVLEYANTLHEEEAQTLFEVCRIDHLLKRRTDQLSGGEKQRIALARLLISSPRLLLLDEPYSNLDLIHKNLLKEVINDIGERLQITCILVSHDPQDSLPWADEIIVIKDGSIIQKAPPGIIYRQPCNEHVAGLFGKYYLMNEKLATAFSIEPGWKDIFIRPEDFRIVPAGQKGVKGKVKNVFFLGSQYELTVVLPTDTITIKTSLHGFRAGDPISIAL